MIMSTPVAVLDVGATLREVAEELTRNEIGAVLVADASRTGLISERDLITAFSAGGNIAHRQIGEVLTSDLVWCSPEDAIVNVGAIRTRDGGSSSPGRRPPHRNRHCLGSRRPDNSGRVHS